MERIKVSIIVPIYNAEQYIKKCAKCLLEQTLNDIEILFIDDCTPDGSVNVIERLLELYPNREKQVKIIHNDNNQGPLLSRINGILQAKGEYVTFVDSDDWVDTIAFENLYEEAIQKNAECLIYGYQRHLTNKVELCERVYPEKNGQEFLSNIYKHPFEFFMCVVLLKNNVSLKLLTEKYYNMPVLKNIRMWEDVAFMFPYYYQNNNICYSKKSYYHYNKTNETSAVNTFNLKKTYDALKVVDYLKNNFRDESLFLTLESMTLGAKNPLLNLKGVQAWRDEHPDCNKYIMRFTCIPFKVRLYYYLLSHGFGFLHFITNH